MSASHSREVIGSLILSSAGRANAADTLYIPPQPRSSLGFRRLRPERSGEGLRSSSSSAERLHRSRPEFGIAGWCSFRVPRHLEALAFHIFDQRHVDSRNFVLGYRHAFSPHPGLRNERDHGNFREKQFLFDSGYMSSIANLDDGAVCVDCLRHHYRNEKLASVLVVSHAHVTMDYFDV